MPKQVYFCEACDTGFWSTANYDGAICPNCLQGTLSEAEATTLESLFLPEPEGILPFGISADLLQHNLDTFLKQLPSKPSDLNVANLTSRLQKVYIPHWWVDVQVKAQWQAQVGFDYEVASHRESVQGGQAITLKVKENRVRWEPRVGLLDRSYTNIPASALYEDHEFKGQVGEFNLTAIQMNAPDQLSTELIRLAQRPPQDAWSEAEINLRQTAGVECQSACEAQHFRQFQWTADYGEKHWTQFLLPVYITYYQDVNRQRHWVMINGQNGRISGDWQADLQRALMNTVLLLGGAGFFLLIGLLLAVTDILPVIGLAIMVVAVLGGAAAFYPFGRAWLFNRSQKPDQGGALT